MNLIDRRFLNISLTVAGVADEPADNPATGIQYIVGENPSGDFASASPNQIARFDGSAWSFITPKAGELEVLNLDTGEILQFNGEEWVTAASLGGEAGSSFSIPVVDDIVYGYHDADDASLTLSPANLKALRGRVFLTEGSSSFCLAVDNFLESGRLGYGIYAGSSINAPAAFAGFGDGKIHSITHNENNIDVVTSTTLNNGEYIFNKADNSLYFYDAANHKFVKVGGKRSYVVDALVDYVGTSLPASFNSGYASFIKLEGSIPRFYYMKQGNTEACFALNVWFSFANIQSLLTDDAGIYSVYGDFDKGVCVIHDLYDGDSIFCKADGCTYIFRDDGNNKSFVKASDSFIAPVLDIVQTGNIAPDNPNAGDRFIVIDSGDYDTTGYLCTADDSHSWDDRTILNGERYASLTNHKIYAFFFDVDERRTRYVIASDIPVGATFLNKADNCLYLYDGSNFINVTVDPEKNPFVAPVLDILNIGSDMPDYPSTAGDKFIYYDTDSDAYGELYTAVDTSDWGNAVEIPNGARYASLNNHKIYTFKGSNNEAVISDILIGESFLNKADNSLYVYDGSNFINTGSSGNAYEPLAPVLAIVPTGASLPATAATGDAFLNISNAKLYTATATNTWDSGTLTANGSRYASSTDHKIYVSNGSALTASNILNGDLFLNKEDNSVYVYDSAASIFRKVGGSAIATEFHSLTAAEVAAKRFTLNHNIAVGQEDNTLLFVSGIAQIVGVDFSASANFISWNNKALDDIALAEGDTFLVQYFRA